MSRNYYVASTTVTQTAQQLVPYHFTCNYCGKRNDQAVDISGSASEARSSSYQHASGTLGVDARNPEMRPDEARPVQEFHLLVGELSAAKLVPELVDSREVDALQRAA